MKNLFVKISNLCLLLIFTIGFAYAETVSGQESYPTYNEFIHPSGLDVGRIDWRPDGEEFAISYDTDVWVYTVQFQELAHLIGHTDKVFGLDWHPDGNQLATSSLDGTIRIWDMDANSPVAYSTITVLQQNKPVWGIAWNPMVNENRLASVTSDGFERGSDVSQSLSTVNIWNVTTQTIEVSSPIQFNGSLSPAWNSDGQLLAYPSLGSNGDYLIRVWNGNTEDLFAEHTIAIGLINAVSWQPNTNNIVYGNDIDMLGLIDFSTILPSEIQSLTTDFEYEIYTLSWNPNGTQLAIGGTEGIVSIWDIALNQKTQILPSHGDDIIQVSWSPNAENIASISRDNILRIWNFSEGDC